MTHNRRGIIIALSLLALISLVTVSPETRSETGDYNIHVELGTGFPLTGWQAEELGLAFSGAARFEFALNDRLGIDVGGGYTQFFQGNHPEDLAYEQMDGAYFANGSLGMRFRLHNDQKGYLRPWKKTDNHSGNLWGNAWIDFHADYFYTGSLNRFGGDVGLGFELSLVNGLQIGPFARGVYIFQPDTANARDSEDGWFLLAGLSFSVSLPPGDQKKFDADNDGFYNDVDMCPEEPEDFDEFEDEDGCPDEDNDRDGILDESDECPLRPEDVDGFEDDDGCPDNDNDRDGVNDAQDRCPMEPEDKDDFEDDDGCPDEDNDKDGILDPDDECPNEPEIFNEVEDEDGCPEPDQDGDGFIDALDECPLEAETVNGVEDDDGCPDEGLVEVREDRILLGERLFFDFGVVRIKTRSKEILNQLANLIISHPEYLLISIEGHADEVGEEEFNEELSGKRAERVMNYLVRQGVAARRLIHVGHGEKKPWMEGASPFDETSNRRVELIILKMDESRAITPVARETIEAVQDKKDPDSESEDQEIVEEDPQDSESEDQGAGEEVESD